MRPCLDCGRITSQSRCSDHSKTYYHSKEWKRLKRAAKRAMPAVCTVCDSTERVTLHHKQGRSEGGLDLLENLMWLCGVCHSQYEADKRQDRNTDLRRIVDSL